MKIKKLLYYMLNKRLNDDINVNVFLQKPNHV